MAPFRGGIAQFNDRLRTTLLSRGHSVVPVSFSRQYPRVLFPGKSQTDPSLTGDAHRLVDSINPLSWSRAGRFIREHADLVLAAYWTPYLAPALAGVLRTADLPAIGLVHNALPHESLAFAKPLARHFLRRTKGVVALSSSVGEQIESLGYEGSLVVSSHPPYDQFGSRIPKTEARKQLGLPPEGPIALCFGLVRPYKGFDLAVEAFSTLRGAMPETTLVIAGESYDPVLTTKIRALGASADNTGAIRWHDQYVADTEIAAYFSAADLLLLPYRSATQSGPLAISRHFGVPVVVTDVPGLAGPVSESGCGLVANGQVSDFADAIRTALRPEVHERLTKAAAGQEGVSWDDLAKTVEDLTSTLSTHI